MRNVFFVPICLRSKRQRKHLAIRTKHTKKRKEILRIFTSTLRFTIWQSIKLKAPLETQQSEQSLFRVALAIFRYPQRNELV